MLLLPSMLYIRSGVSRTSSRCIVVIQYEPVDKLFRRCATSGPRDSDSRIQSMLCLSPAFYNIRVSNLIIHEKLNTFFVGVDFSIVDFLIVFIYTGFFVVWDFGCEIFDKFGFTSVRLASDNNTKMCRYTVFKKIYYTFRSVSGFDKCHMVES